MDVIPFTPRRFQTAAAAYLQGRPDYPARLFQRIAELCRLDRSHRVMDLGCGPGQIAVALAPYVGRIVGIDPEPEMLKIAAELTAHLGDQIELIEGSSYDLGPRLGSFHLVTMGRSFHWMARAETLRRLDAMIDPDGAVVLIHDEHPKVPDNAWDAPFQDVITRYAADDVAKQVRSNWASHEAVLLDSPFNHLERITVFERRQITVDALILRTHSMSSVARSRIGAKADDLDVEVREAMAAFAQDGMLNEVIASSALIASRGDA